MRIRGIRALNNTEIYCCNPKALKLAFKDRDVEVSFGTIGQHSRNMAKNSLYHLPKEKGNIIVLLVFSVEKRRENFLGFYTSSRMYIQIIEKKAFPDNLQYRFEQEVIPRLVDYFDKHIDYDVTKNQQAHQLIVGLSGVEFKFYEKLEFRAQ